MKKTDRVKFGRLIRKYRFEHGFGVKDMAERCGLSDVSIAYLERGKHEPNSKTVFKICRGMGMSYQDICRMVGNKETEK